MHRELERDFLHHHIHHAYLLIGKEEDTQRDAAAFAMALNCVNPQGGKACGLCRPCLLAKDNAFCDFTVVTPEKEILGVKEMRNFVKTAALSPQEGKYQVFAIGGVDKMRAEALNAILKTIEEPNPETVMILQGENYDAILPTITSRCHVLRYIEAEPLSDAILDNAYQLLTTLSQVSCHSIFQENQRAYTKKKKELTAVLQGMEMILSENYQAQYQEEPHLQRSLNKEIYTKEVLFSLWEKAINALEYLFYQVNPRLIADTFFLAVKEVNGGL